MLRACSRTALALRGRLTPRGAAAPLHTSHLSFAAGASKHSSTVDPQETAKFEADADHWCGGCAFRRVSVVAEAAAPAGGMHSAGLLRRCTQ